MTQSATELKPAAGYVRVSLKRQAEGESPENQRERIQRRAAEDGYYLAFIEEDHDKGGRTTREGYQRVLDAARAGTIHAVFCYSLSRWGRNAAERLTRGQELDKLRVKLISVLQGHDKAGMYRSVWAGMDEEYSRQLAANVREAKERSATKGVHQGVTPLGYKRVYAQRENSSRYQAGVLTENEQTSWLIKELYTRYAAGGWSFRRLAQWLNSDETAFPRAPRGGQWNSSNVRYILQNPVYKGGVRYNASHFGVYETSDPGSMFVADGSHVGFIEPPVFDAVQELMNAQKKRHVYNKLNHTAPMGAGVLVCADCGGPMIPRFNRQETWNTYYTCLDKNSGKTRCPSGSYSTVVAHWALLEEIKRVRGLCLDKETIDATLAKEAGHDEHALERKNLQRALQKAQEQKVRNMRLLQRIDEPTDDEIAEFRRVGAEIASTIKTLEGQLVALPMPTINMDVSRAVLYSLINVDIATVITATAQRASEVGASEVEVQSMYTPIMWMIDSARLVDRVPTNKSKWARAEVTWSPAIQLLMRHGLITLGPAPERPFQPITAAEYDKRKYERRKAKRGAYWRKDGAVPQG